MSKSSFPDIFQHCFFIQPVNITCRQTISARNKSVSSDGYEGYGFYVSGFEPYSRPWGNI